jgi:hypothetical protein
VTGEIAVGDYVTETPRDKFGAQSCALGGAVLEQQTAGRR